MIEIDVALIILTIIKITRATIIITRRTRTKIYEKNKGDICDRSKKYFNKKNDSDRNSNYDENNYNKMIVAVAANNSEFL